MIVARGYAVSLELEDGATVRGAKGAWLLHDETGREIPADVAVVMPFTRTGRPLSSPTTSDAERHFQKNDYAPLEGRGTLPPLDSGWKKLGAVRWIRYSRKGKYHLPQGHEHEFGRGVFGKMPTLYRRGDALKIVGVTWKWDGAHG